MADSTSTKTSEQTGERSNRLAGLMRAIDECLRTIAALELEIVELMRDTHRPAADANAVL